MISTIIRTIDGRIHLLEEALLSLEFSDYPNIEAIIIYQGNSQEYLNQLTQLTQKFYKLQFQILQNKEKKDQRARNLALGVENSNGSYIHFLDDDDCIIPHAYTKLTEAIKKYNAPWCYGRTLVHYYQSQTNLYYKGERVFHEKPKFKISKIIKGNYIPIHSMLFQKSSLRKINIDSGLTRYEDYAIILQLIYQKLFPVYIKDIVAVYRFFTDGSNTIPAIREEKDQTWISAEKQIQTYRDRIKQNLLLIQLAYFAELIKHKLNIN